MSEPHRGQGENPPSNHPEIKERLRDLGLLDDPEFLVDVLRTFITDGEETIARLGNAILESPDPSACEQAAHRLKGASLNIGAEGLGHLARRLEESGRSGDLEAAPPIFRELESEFAGVRLAAQRLADRAAAA